MLEKELKLERELFLFLNEFSSPFWDNVMYIYSYKFAWIPFYLCFVFVFCFRKNWKEITLAILAVTLIVFFCDFLSSSWSKPFFQRFRPTHHPDFKDVVNIAFDYRGGRYGFFSGHAANSFGFATLISLMFRNSILTITIFIFAIITAYTRIYLGVHFISDIVVGTIAGIIVGFFVYELYIIGRKYWLKVPDRNLRKSIYSKNESLFLCGAYVCMIAIILIFNNQIINLIT